MTLDDRTHRASSYVPAPPSAVYEALVDAHSLAQWLPPTGATCRVDLFEPWEGGRFKFTLTFAAHPGKSGSFTDEVHGRFVELEPGARVVQEISFQSADPAFAGIMTMDWRLTVNGDGTRVAVVADRVPSGISREEHEQGMASTLANLARFVGHSAEPLPD